VISTFLARSPASDYSEILVHSSVMDFDGRQVRVLSIDALIRAKETAGRPKGASGLQELYALKDSANE